LPSCSAFCEVSFFLFARASVFCMRSQLLTDAHEVSTRTLESARVPTGSRRPA
jgi:hypothetical protein